MSGGSISGYEIFRKLGRVTTITNGTDGADAFPSSSSVGANQLGFEFDYRTPIATLEGSNHTNFTDSHGTTRHPPIPGTVYFYEVRPIVEGVLSRPLGDESIVRIFSPPENYAFVHRWIANETMCNLMHAETNEDGDYRIQSFDDYRKCKYEGPGNDNNYYDLKYDYLVMQARPDALTQDVDALAPIIPMEIVLVTMIHLPRILRRQNLIRFTMTEKMLLVII